MKKIAVFLGDMFWSTVPYDGLHLQSVLKEKFGACDLIMFSEDVRLKRYNEFIKNESLRVISTWNDLYKISEEYKLILTSVHIAPKTRYPHDIKKLMKCPIMVWDIGGADILTNAPVFATYYCVKGNIWKTWLKCLKCPQENIFVTGSPHYDGYFAKYDLDAVCQKYNVENNSFVLVATSNPRSHLEQFNQNLKYIKELSGRIPVIIKLHPLDHMGLEKDKPYSGIYNRGTLKDAFGDLKIADPADHHALMLSCNRLFNAAGSHIAWETYLTQKPSITMNYSNKKYFGGVSYIKNVKYPDALCNIEVDYVDDILNASMPSFNGMEEYISNEISVFKIRDAVEIVLSRI
jgi:hypothetical protein